MIHKANFTPTDNSIRFIDNDLTEHVRTAVAEMNRMADEQLVTYLRSRGIDVIQQNVEITKQQALKLDPDVTLRVSLPDDEYTVIGKRGYHQAPEYGAKGHRYYVSAEDVPADPEDKVLGKIMEIIATDEGPAEDLAVARDVLEAVRNHDKENQS